MITGREPLCDHARGHPRGHPRGGGRGEPGGDPTAQCPWGDDLEVLGTEVLLGALARREHRLVAFADPAVRLLGALIDDVDQRLSSVSITPST